jgi:hypothetical protein
MDGTNEEKGRRLECCEWKKIPGKEKETCLEEVNDSPSSPTAD